MKRNISIGQRLGTGFGVLLLWMAGFLALVSYWQAQSLAAEAALRERIQPLREATESLERSVLNVGLGVRAYLLRPEAVRLKRHAVRVDEARAWLRKLGELEKEPDGEALYGRLAPLVDQYVTRAEVIVERARSGDAVAPQLEIELTDTREATMTEIQAFAALQDQKLREALTDVSASRERVSQALTSGAFLALLFFAILGYYTIQSVRRPTQMLLAVAGKLREGDWRPALEWAPSGTEARPLRNELARLGQAFGAAAVTLERREQRLRADREVAGATASSLDKESIAEAALQAVGEHVRAEVSALFWRDPDSQTLRPIATRALSPAQFASVRLGEGVPGQAAKEQRTVVVRDIPSDTPFGVKLGYDQAPPRAVIAVPIRFQDHLLGVLLLASLRDFDRETIAFLDAAAGQLGIGFYNARAYEEIQRLLRELGEKNEEVQAQNEELQVQNEEIQAQNEEIQAQNEELQAQGEEIQAQNDELTSQAEQLRKHADALADADRRKNEFLGLLAHELRNPMASISSSLYLLARTGADSEPAKRAQAIIDRQTRQLTRLVDDLLDIARISSGKVRLQRERLDLTQLVRECVEDYRLALGEQDRALELELPDETVPFYGDRARLGQVLSNLMDNAIKFTNAGQRISVSLRVHANPGDVCLSVSDNGIGIEPGLLPQLFEPFSQAESSLARSRGGLGLGLALVKGLVDLHGGTLDVHSAGPGKGAEFKVYLPRIDDPASPEESRPATMPPGSSSAQPRRILIVEDNVDAADSLRDALRCAGHEVHLAYSALDALPVARSVRPDVIFCDIGLPTMDGYEFARRVRQVPELQSVFLVAMTGYASVTDKERAAEAGFDRHLAKPASIDLLNEILAGRA